MRIRLLPGLLVLAGALVASTDVASAPSHAVRNGTVAASIGAPNAGKLLAGQKLEPSQEIRLVPASAGRGYQWALPSLVHGLERAAHLVERRYPGVALSVGDLSRKGGGEVGHHRSHQSGRDADIGFYMLGRDGAPAYADEFIVFGPAGNSPVSPLRFDDERNWALVEALLGDPSLRVQRIFVSTPLRARLLHEAERVGAPLSVRLRAAEAMVQPRGSIPHDDHFHVRIACPSNGAESCEAGPRISQTRRAPTEHHAGAAARPRQSTGPRALVDRPAPASSRGAASDGDLPLQSVPAMQATPSDDTLDW